MDVRHFNVRSRKATQRNTLALVPSAARDPYAIASALDADFDAYGDGMSQAHSEPLGCGLLAFDGPEGRPAVKRYA